MSASSPSSPAMLDDDRGDEDVDRSEEEMEAVAAEEDEMGAVSEEEEEEEEEGGWGGGGSGAHDILRELIAHVVSVSPSRGPYFLRENIALVIKLTRRLLDTSVAAAEAQGADPAGLDAAAAAALQPMLEATIGLIAVDAKLAKEERGRTMRSCGVQILGALAMSGTLDLGGLVPLVRHKGLTDSPGHPVSGDARYMCTGVATCLMDKEATTGRPLHSAAASLLGKGGPLYIIYSHPPRLNGALNSSSIFNLISHHHHL